MRHGPFAKRDFAEHFWSRVDKSAGLDHCWPWMGAFLNRHSRFRYGELTRFGKLLLAHRVAWELTNGPIPEGKLILHSCDNPPCCSPAHLRAGTEADNVTDMIAKGRNPRRDHEYGANTKLSWEKVRLIRSLYATGKFTRRELAQMVGVSSQSYIGKVLTGTKWRESE